MPPHCFVYYDKTWMKTVFTCLTKTIAEQPSLTQYDRPMYHERKINILPSADKQFMIFFFFFFFFLRERDLVLNLGVFFFFYSHCIIDKDYYSCSEFSS